MSTKCNIPPPGWTCSRPSGHENPCAASPIDEGYYRSCKTCDGFKVLPHRMDGEVALCACGQPSQHESGWCGGDHTTIPCPDCVQDKSRAEQFIRAWGLQDHPDVTRMLPDLATALTDAYEEGREDLKDLYANLLREHDAWASLYRDAHAELDKLQARGPDQYFEYDTVEALDDGKTYTVVEVLTFHVIKVELEAGLYRNFLPHQIKLVKP